MIEALGDALSGLFGAIIGGVIVVSGQYILAEVLRRRDANYAAIRIVCLLEEYFEKCVEVVLDDGTFQGQPAGRTNEGQEYLKPRVSLPTTIAYPDDINWKSLSPKLMFRSFKLSNASISINRSIVAASQDAFPPDYEEYFAARHEGYARLGIEALDLSKAFKKAYGISEETKSDSYLYWDPEERLRSTLKEIEDRRKPAGTSPLDSLRDATTETGKV